MNKSQAEYLTSILFKKSDERQQATVAVVIGEMLASEAERKYGMPVNSVSRDVRNVNKRYDEAVKIMSFAKGNK